MEITQSYLKEIFDYREDGNLIWKVKKANNINIGDCVGGLNNEGYLSTSINGAYYKVHRLIFLFHFGFVNNLIDHIDGNKTNNKIENLRIATHSENSKNQKIKITNTSGVKGVNLQKNTKKWRARITINKKETTIGFFDNLFSAAIARKEAEQKYYGEFAYKGN